jgi:D-glycero-D-manno-heptose 1,7-bisphosphate phosphatase
VSSRRAVFLDRDGTLIEDPGYLRDPDAVRLLPGAAQAVARLNEAGFLAIVVTNQSGIARGLLTAEDYASTESRLDALMHAQGARLDAHYFCPHLPQIDGPCECRKPGPLLYRRAADRFDLDLGASWWIGDRLRDVEAALPLGGRGILVATGPVPPPDDVAAFQVATDLLAAVGAVLADSPMHYFPPP